MSRQANLYIGWLFGVASTLLMIHSTFHPFMNGIILAVAITVLAEPALRADRRDKTPDIRLPENHRTMNRTSGVEHVMTQEQFERIVEAQKRGKDHL